MVKAGLLVFKGGEVAGGAAAAKKKKSKKIKDKKAAAAVAAAAAAADDEDGSGAFAAACGSAAAAVREEDEMELFEPVRGSGRISSSGTTIHGYDGTRFMSELHAGDAIIVRHPSTLVDETRIVKMVLSDVSIGVSSAFSSDLITTTPFRFVKAPKEIETEENTQKKKKKAKLDEEKNAFGTYDSAGGQKFVYRVKKAGVYGGYQIITETDTGPKSREELLEMRCKKKADRNCY